jgi:hypothetical protein
MGSHYGVALGAEGVIVLAVIYGTPLVLVTASIAFASIGKRRRHREAVAARRARDAQSARAALVAQQARLAP